MNHVHVDNLLKVVLTHSFDPGLEASECISVSIRTHNLAGLYSTISHHLVGCTRETRQEMLVIDAVREWDEERGDVR